MTSQNDISRKKYLEMHDAEGASTLGSFNLDLITVAAVMLVYLSFCEKCGFYYRGKFLDSCQPDKGRVQSATQTVIQARIQLTLDPCLSDGLSGGFNPPFVWLT